MMQVQQLKTHQPDQLYDQDMLMGLKTIERGATPCPMTKTSYTTTGTSFLTNHLPNMEKEDISGKTVPK